MPSKSHLEILRRLHELNYILFFWQIGAGSGSNYVERGYCSREFYSFLCRISTELRMDKSRSKAVASSGCVNDFYLVRRHPEDLLSFCNQRSFYILSDNYRLQPHNFSAPLWLNRHPLFQLS